MLLSCCFKEQRSRKGSKKYDEGSRKNDNESRKNKDDEEWGIRPQDGGHQLKREKTGRGSPLYTVHSATLRSASQLELKLTQEKHPPSKETKRLLKQRSQESIKQELLHSKEKESGRVEEQHLRKEKDDNGEWSVLRTNFPYIDQSPLDQGLGGFRVPGADQTNSISTIGTRTETYEDEEKRKDSVSTIQSVSCRNSFLGPPPSDERGKKTKKGLSSNAYSVPNLNDRSRPPLPPYPLPPPVLSPRNLPFHSTPMSLSSSIHLNSTPVISNRGPNEDVSYTHSRSSSRHNSVQYEPYSRHNSVQSDSNSAHTSAQYDSPTRLGSGVCTDASQNSVHEETPIVRGLQRSTAFHNAITLQEQLKLDEERDRLRREEEKEEERRREGELRSRIAAEYELKLVEKDRELTRSIDEHRRELSRLKEEHRIELTRIKEEKSRILEQTLTKYKNDENERISSLRDGLENERRRIEEREEKVRRECVEEVERKEKEMIRRLDEVEDRERLWQEEKDEVLAEVQRLKAEASRMVKLLAQEMEEEEKEMSEDRKRTLNQEVSSLLLILEMRTSELRTLRDKNNVLEDKMEKFEVIKEELNKSRARVEDLEEQLRMKDRMEKQLSYEKCELEQSMEQKSRVAERMSQNVEELQWRIRNNFELPLSVVGSEQPSSLPDCSAHSRSPITSPVHRPSSTPLPILGGRSPTNLYSPFYRGDQSSNKQPSPSVLNQKNTLSNEPGFPYFAPTQPSSSSSTPLFSVSEKVQPTSSEKCGNNNSDLSKNNKRENQQNINKETTPITTTIHNSNPMHTAFNNNNNNTSQNININNITTSNTSNTMQSMSPAISSPTHQKWNCFSVSREMIEATSFQPTSQDENAATSDFSPSSDGLATSLPGEQGSETDNNLQENDSDKELDEESDKDDVDSLDEGLGDISSENEHPESPQPEKLDQGSEKDGAPLSERKLSITSLQNSEMKLELSNPTVSPSKITQSPTKNSDNRLPSRISFETPL